MEELESLHKNISVSREDFFTTNMSTTEIDIICSSDLANKVLKHFKMKPKIINHNLAAWVFLLTHRFSVFRILFFHSFRDGSRSYKYRRTRFHTDRVYFYCGREGFWQDCRLVFSNCAVGVKWYNNSVMKIYIGTDHAGYVLKEALVTSLKGQGYDVIDMGAFEYDEADDYPDFVIPVAQAVSKDPDGSKGIILGATGEGEAIAANKFPHVRAIVDYGKATPVVEDEIEYNFAFQTTQ